jgi:hypothetical protein
MRHSLTFVFYKQFGIKKKTIQIYFSGRRGPDLSLRLTCMPDTHKMQLITRGGDVRSGQWLQEKQPGVRVLSPYTIL